MSLYYSNSYGSLYFCDYFKADLQTQCDLMLTDPPYGITSQKWDTAPDWSVFFNTAKKFITRSAAIVFTMTQPQSSLAVCANIKAYQWAYVWLKNKASGHLSSASRPMRNHEDILVFCNNVPTYNPQVHWTPNLASIAINKGRTGCYGGARSGSVYNGNHERSPKTAIYCPVVNNDDPDRIHSNQKPVPLWEYLVKTFSNDHDTIFDPFAGSGTTAIAAQNCGRKWIMFEANESACEKIANRLEGYKPHLQPEGSCWEDYIRIDA